jgi:protein phosphatase
MKIAIISDIHANLEALKATIKDIEKRNVDKIICLGDIVSKGAHQRECLDIIKDKCDIVIRGNCDRHFATKHNNIEEMTEIERNRIIWNQKILTKEDREYLYNLPFCEEFYIAVWNRWVYNIFIQIST